MDEHLQTIINLSAAKFRDLCASARNAREMLNNSDVTMVTLCGKCLYVLQLALQCKHQKINQAAVDLLQTLIRDERFMNKASTSEIDTLIMSALKSVTLLPVIKAPIQCRILTLIVEIMCKEERRITIETIMEALKLCMQTYGNAEERSVRLACRAAITQIFNSFCTLPQNRHCQEYIAIFMDSTSLLNEVIKCANVTNPQSDQIVILLDAIYSLLSSQPITITNHEPFVNAIWHELSPCMMKMLGEPEKNTRDIAEGNELFGRSQRPMTTNSKTIFDHPEIVLSLYQIVEQLLRILAGVHEMRSVLEAIFHKALLYPRVDQRSEALRIIRKITKNEERLADIVLISVNSKSLTLWTAIVDCIVECSNSTNIDIASEALRTLQTILATASQMCEADSDGILSAQLIDSILAYFPTDDISLASVIDDGQISEKRDNKQDGIKEAEIKRKSLLEDLKSTDEITEVLQKLSKKYKREETDVVICCDSADNKSAEEEIETANCYINKLRNAIPKWMQIKSTIEIDEAIQEFASNFFSEFMLAQKDAFELHGQAQSHFLNSDAIYLTTYAALAVIYYENNKQTFNKFWFINEVLRSDCIVYSSDHWLTVVYENLIKLKMKIKYLDDVKVPLISVIEDYTGHSAQIMSDVRRIRQMFIKKNKHSLAACRACRWLLLATQNKLLTSPSKLLSLRNTQHHIVRPKAAEAFDQAIYTLLAFAKLCTEEYNQLIIEQLVMATCPLDELRSFAIQEKIDSVAERFNRWPLRRSDVIAMQTILDIATDCGLRAPKCWNSIIRFTEYILEVEKYLFGVITQDQTNWLPSVSFNRDTANKAQHIDDILPNSNDDILSTHTACQILQFLISEISKFYERVGKELNLASLYELMQNLVVASKNCQHYVNSQKSNSLADPAVTLGWIFTISITLSTRPLIHTMKIWPQVAHHIVQCASLRNNGKLNFFAIEGLGVCIAKLMINEANGFCYNQLIFQPLQNILCAEMCLEESQEQIVTLLATFVHSHANVIGSGWQPLFSALKALRNEDHTGMLGKSENNGNDVTTVSSVQATVLDIFSAYLNIKNTNVLITTALDYITCVLQYLHSTGSENEAMIPSSNVTMASTALQNLLKMERMLHNLFDSVDCIDQHLLQRLTLRERTQHCVDRYTAISFLMEPLSTVLIEEQFFDVKQKIPLTDLDRLLEAPEITVPWKNYTASRRSCIEVYLSLLEGLIAITFICPASLQSNLLRTIADLIKEQMDTKFGINFGAYALSILVFPMLQQWMRKDAAKHENNLKQAIGLFTEVVKQYLIQTKNNQWVNRTLFDTLILLTECITCSSNRIARFGYACLRFLTRSSVNSLTTERWTIIVRSLWNATSLTLAHLRFLIQYYVVDSNDPNGDLGNVCIAAVENSKFSCETLLLARQIFLTDEQICSVTEMEETRKREVVLCNNDGIEQRIPGDELVNILTSHQYILELIGTLLLNGVDLPVDKQTAAFLKKFDEQTESDNGCNLHKLSPEDIIILFRCLDGSFLVAKNFDKRSGLKMLIQGLYDFPVLPNLCKQIVLAWTIRSLAMYEMVRKCPLKKETIVECLSSSDENVKDDKYYVKQLQLCHREVCKYLCNLEKKLSTKALRHLARSHVTQQITLIRNDAVDENLYKLVSSEQTTEIISDYKRSKVAQTLALPTKRCNPFKSNDEQHQTIAEEKLILSDGETRCCAWTEMSLAILEACLREESEQFEKLLPIIYENSAILISGSSNMRVREFAGRFLRKISNFHRFS
ncbi:unnamed protein product [Cercopithifilaria johnstoni]|uniref:Mon2/Sec7/BIG1-like HDS domain-containing protein n=1 Tax=Cercopithifilaria johnstoni TaxID=2874296 RepID=A0A8J2M0W7_9BILA|nr:unnamed protein product [Cercopithifilaria johnstoni]